MSETITLVGEGKSAGEISWGTQPEKKVKVNLNLKALLPLLNLLLLRTQSGCLIVRVDRRQTRFINFRLKCEATGLQSDGPFRVVE